MSISVIIPVYNVESYLRQCIDSVISQNHFDIEVVCVDDGSTDGSGRILDEYVEKNSCIRVVHQCNMGLAYARNRGLDLATKEYILFLDSDDYLGEHALEKAYNRARQYDADMCVFDAQDFDCDSGKLLKHNYFNYRRVQSLGPVFKATSLDYHLFDTISSVCWVKLVKREFLLGNDISFELRGTFEDSTWTSLLVALAQKITVVPEKLLYHRTYRKDSLLNSIDEHLKDPIDSYQNAFEELSKRGLLSDDISLASFLNKTAGIYYYTIRNFNQYERASEYWKLIHSTDTILYKNSPYEEKPETPDINNYMKWREQSLKDYLLFEYKRQVRTIGALQYDLEKKKKQLSLSKKTQEGIEKNNSKVDGKNRKQIIEIKRKKQKIADNRCSKVFRIRNAIMDCPRKIKNFLR